MKSKSARWHTIYSIVSTILEITALAAALIWVLPIFDITLSWWGIALILVAFLGYSYLMYRISHPLILYESISAPEAIIGNKGVVEVDLNPEGYVRVRGELWKASCADGPLTRGDEVTVTSYKGMRIEVEKKTRRIR